METKASKCNPLVNMLIDTAGIIQTQNDSVQESRVCAIYFTQ